MIQLNAPINAATGRVVTHARTMDPMTREIPCFVPKGLPHITCVVMRVPIV